MADIIVAFQSVDDTRAIKNVLVKNGYSVIGTVTSGAQVINLADDIDYCLVICGYQLSDMQYLAIKSMLNESCEMLVVCSPSKLDGEYSSEVHYLSMPLKVGNLIEKVEDISSKLYYERKKKKSLSDRGKRNFAVIDEAKSILMDRKKMSEPEAHKYLQSLSMKNGDTLQNVAKKICLLYK